MSARLTEFRKLIRIDQHATFPLWLKITVTICYFFICRGTWQQYSGLNFLWFSHIGFMGAVLALWLESKLLASMMLLNTFMADGVGWTLDLFVALATGWHPLGATAYMFDQQIGLLIRALSLFHIGVPVLLVTMVYKLGYDRRALVTQAMLAWSVLLLCIAFTDPQMNINRVFGPGTQRQAFMPGWLYFLILLVYVPLAFYLPIHLTLVRGLKWERPIHIPSRS